MQCLTHSSLYGCLVQLRLKGKMQIAFDFNLCPLSFSLAIRGLWPTHELKNALSFSTRITWIWTRWCDDVEVGLIDILLMSSGGARCINATRDGDCGRGWLPCMHCCVAGHQSPLRSALGGIFCLLYWCMLCLVFDHGWGSSNQGKVRILRAFYLLQCAGW